MSDKGFNIKDLLETTSATLNTTPFLLNETYLNEEEDENTQSSWCGVGYK